MTNTHLTRLVNKIERSLRASKVTSRVTSQLFILGILFVTHFSTRLSLAQTANSPLNTGALTPSPLKPISPSVSKTPLAPNPKPNKKAAQKTSPVSSSQEIKAKLLREEDPKKRIQGLEVTLLPVDQNAPEKVRLKITLSPPREGALLLDQLSYNYTSQASKPLTWELRRTLAKVSPLRFLFVNAQGEVEPETIILAREIPTKKAKNSSAKKELSPFSWGFSLGPTVFSYTEKLTDTSITGINLTVKAVANYAFKNIPWVIGANTYFSALPLSQKAQSLENRLTWERGESQLRFLGVNLRAGYQLLKSYKYLRLDLSVGATYLTTLSAGALPVGYRNIILPQFYPSASILLSPRNQLGIYAKLVPAGPSSFVPNFSEREIAFGLNWSYLMSQSSSDRSWIRSLNAGLDFSEFKINLGGESVSTTTSFSLGLNF